VTVTVMVMGGTGAVVHRDVGAGLPQFDGFEEGGARGRGRGRAR